LEGEALVSLGFGLYAVGAVFWSACAVAYGIRSPWWRSLIGRSLFGSWTALACVLILAAVFRVLPLPHPVIVVLAVVVLTAVDVAGLVQLVTVLHLQRQDRSVDR
jgi:hypothetical protein